MANILDYIQWRGDVPWEVSQFNKIDNVIFTQLAYIDFSDIVDDEKMVLLKDGAQQYFAEERHKMLNTGYIAREEYFQLLELCMESSRFGELVISDYVKKIDITHEMQFSAITIHMRNEIYVSYCGTDDTIVGWKEDFNMSVLDHVPSQKEAKKYLEKIACKYPDKQIYVGGHSKGGNLAVYAASYVSDEIQSRILQIYNNDGPGFKERLDDNLQYQNICAKIVRIVPEFSVVGLLMEHGDNYEVVQSDEKGLAQHSVFTWQLKGTAFLYEKDLAITSQLADKTLKRILSETSLEQREQITQIVFGILQGDENKTLSDIRQDGVKALFSMVKSYDNLDNEAKKAVGDTVSLFINESIRSLKEEVNQNDLKEQLKSAIAKLSRKEKDQ